MSEENLKEIKKYLLEEGKEYRKNILLYLKWVLERYDERKVAHSSVVQSTFNNIYPFYIEGIKTKNEWSRINKRAHNNFVLEHKTTNKDVYKSGWLICVKLSQNELENFLNLFKESDFPQKIMTWEYKMPSEEDFKKAIEIYNELEWTPAKQKVVIEGKEYQLTALSSIAIGIANNLDSPANFYMFTTHELQKYIKENCKNFKIIESENSLNEENTNNGEGNMLQIQPLNQILYGPPGTGKTYNTINKALDIIFEKENRESEFDFKIKDEGGKEVSPIKKSYTEILALGELEKRKHLKGLFEYFKDEKQGQIEFVTFHQSYGYEEFVEGIKAKTIIDEQTKQKVITYDIESGVFKQICEKAKSIQLDKASIYDFDENINIWKISLGDSQNSEDEYLFDYCVKENKILLGFGDGLDFSECNSRTDIANLLGDNEKYSYPPTALNTLKNKMKKNDIVLVSYGNRKLRAIAKITEDYQHINDDNLKTYVQARGVDWLLVPNEAFSYEKILKKQLSQMSIYDIKNNVKIEALKSLLTRKNISNSEANKRYILIIDEINRGNISKIFGELITLIEPSKRIGAQEEIRVRLPYSGENGEMFGVPQNLYIIGTMNTADRSIALMDTALRRRFDFTEIMPQPELLVDDSGNEFKVGDINIKLLLETINKRIEYLYDRDHTIGHAYFMSLKDKNGDRAKAELDNIFRNKIIPLLQEYFYDDWEKIQIILGDHSEQFKKKSKLKEFNAYKFVQSIEIKEIDILGFDHPDIENDSVEYQINSEFKTESYMKIYGAYPEVKTDEKQDNTNTSN